MREEYTLNDLLFTPGPIKEIPRDTSVDPDWNEEAAKERSRQTWAKLEQMEREFEERTKDLVVS